MAGKNIAITETEARAIIGRLRQGDTHHPLHSIELSLLGRLTYEVKERERPRARLPDFAQTTFDFGDV